MKYFLTLVLMIGVCAFAIAQHDSSACGGRFAPEVNFFLGKLIKIHDEFPEAKAVKTAEVFLAWRPDGSKGWHQWYKLPKVGVALVAADLGNARVLNQAFGAIPSMSYRKDLGKWKWDTRLGFGLAWFSKPYDALNNPENLVIGSRYANMTMLRTAFSKEIGKNLALNIGASFMHCSNAHVRVPNIGANVISISAGLTFGDNETCVAPVHSAAQRKRKWIPTIQAIGGWHAFPGTVRPQNGPLYAVYGANVSLARNDYRYKGYTMAKGRYSVGFNLYYYDAYFKYMVLEELFPGEAPKKSKALNAAAYLGYEWNYGHVAFFVQGGLNLYAPAMHALNKVWDLPKHGWLHEYTSNKLGYRIYLFDPVQQPDRTNVFLSTAVKANGGTADFFEVAVGATF